MADFLGAPCSYECYEAMEYDRSGYGDLEAALPKHVSDKFHAWLKVHLISSMENHFGKIIRDIISSPGFNDSVNDYCEFVLDQAVAVIPELKAAMFIPGARHRLLNFMKVLVKESLVLLLVADGEHYKEAKAFVDMYVSDTI